MIYVIALRQAARTGDRWQLVTAGRCCPVLTTPYVRPWPTPAVPACDFRCWISA